MAPGFLQAVLLDGVGELVGEEVLAFRGFRAVLAGAEDDVLTDGVGVGVLGAGGLRGHGVGVDAYIAEAVAEA